MNFDSVLINASLLQFLIGVIQDNLHRRNIGDGRIDLHLLFQIDNCLGSGSAGRAVHPALVIFNDGYFSLGFPGGIRHGYFQFGFSFFPGINEPSREIKSSGRVKNLRRVQERFK